MTENTTKTLTSLGPSPVKRSIFKKSQWAKSAEPEEDEGMFSRAKELFPTVVADTERMRKEKKKRNSDTARLEQDIEDESKRRRVSPDEEPTADTGLRAYNPPNSPNTTTNIKGSPSKIRLRSSAADAKVEAKRQTSKAPSIISLGDSSDEEPPSEAAKSKSFTFDEFDSYDSDVEPIKPPRQVPIPQAIESIPDDEDDPFAEFIAQARQKATRGKLLPRLPRTDSPSSDNSGTPRATPTSIPSVVDDPVVNILVTSQIAGTKEWILKRKASQRMKDVRMTWSDRQRINGQPFDDDTKRSIFLTFRGTRVFDVSTCSSLGVTLDANGRIHLEAWTQEIFDAYKKRRDADRQRREFDPLDEPADADEVAEPEQAPEDEIKPMRIFIKAKGLKDCKVMVKPQTHIAKMVYVFKIFHNLPLDTDVELRFDGDRLEMESVASEYDLEEMSSVDAYVRGQTTPQ